MHTIDAKLCFVFIECSKIKIDRIFHLLFLEDDLGQKWIKIGKNRQVLWVLQSNVSTAKRKHDKMQSQNGIRIPTYVACGFGRPQAKNSPNQRYEVADFLGEELFLPLIFAK